MSQSELCDLVTESIKEKAAISRSQDEKLQGPPETREAVLKSRKLLEIATISLFRIEPTLAQRGVPRHGNGQPHHFFAVRIPDGGSLMAFAVNQGAEPDRFESGTASFLHANSSNAFNERSTPTTQQADTMLDHDDMVSTLSVSKTDSNLLASGGCSTESTDGVCCEPGCGARSIRIWHSIISCQFFKCFQ
jgi:hypothetical protein